MAFPVHRPRRLRATESIRALVRETALAPDDFILPLFVCPGEGVKREIGAMPGNYQMSIDEIVKECDEVASLGVSGVILFGIPETKDEMASGGYDDQGIVQRAVRAIKREVPKLHRHDRRVQLRVHQPRALRQGGGGRRGQRRDAGVAGLVGRLARPRRRGHRRAVGHDGRARGGHPQGARRRGLRPKIPILSYAAKFASCFYGPFREAAESAPQFGDRRSYQMDPANGREAMREIALDLEEGADMIMVKPALPVSGPHPAGARPLRRSDRGLPGKRRIQHDHGRRPQRLDRPGPAP